MNLKLGRRSLPHLVHGYSTFLGVAGEYTEIYELVSDTWTSIMLNTSHWTETFVQSTQTFHTSLLLYTTLRSTGPNNLIVHSLRSSQTVDETTTICRPTPKALTKAVYGKTILYSNHLSVLNKHKSLRQSHIRQSASCVLAVAHYNFKFLLCSVWTPNITLLLWGNWFRWVTTTFTIAVVS